MLDIRISTDLSEQDRATLRALGEKLDTVLALLGDEEAIKSLTADVKDRTTKLSDALRSVAPQPGPGIASP